MIAEQPSDADDRRRSAARFLHFLQSAGTLEVAKRRQRVLRDADDIMETLPPWPELDAEYFEQYRRAMVDSGATDADLEYFADYLVRLVIEMTVSNPEDRAGLLEAVVNHFALTDIEIHLGRDDVTVVKVVFPDRPKAQ